MSSPGADEVGSADQIQVVATMSVFADFARQVGGSQVEVVSIVAVGGDPHTYQPTPSDAVAISEADIVLDNGLGLSPWFEPLQTNISGELVTLTEAIAEEAQASLGKVDPHMWMVPRYVADGYLTAIEQALIQADPSNQELYAANAERYRQEIAELDESIVATLAVIPIERRKLVTSHDAYSYFADHYDLELVGTIVGVTTEEEPSAQSVRNLIDQITAEGVPAVFFETTINPALAETVARDAKVTLGEPLYGDSVGQPGTPEGDYAGMMRANASAIANALAARR